MEKKHILITGIPGTGKTFVGQFLEGHHNYKHEDIERWLNRDERFGKNPNIDLIDKTIEEILDPGKDLVATFGFRPMEIVDLAIVDRLLKQWNFKMFWFDGNRGAALREYVQRELRQYTNGQITGPVFYANVTNFFIQVQNIFKIDIAARFNPIIINPFDKDEKFRKPLDIVQEIESYFQIV